MICTDCGNGNHENCRAVITESVTWCDCQHKVSTSQTQSVDDWLKTHGPGDSLILVYPDGQNRPASWEEVSDKVALGTAIDKELAKLKEGLWPNPDRGTEQDMP